MKKISRINDNDEEVTIQEVTSINSQLSNLEIPFINASQTPLLPPPQSLPTNFPGSSSLHQPISTATILPPTSSSYRTNLASTCASTGTGTATATSTMASSTTKHCINTVLNFVKKKVKHVRTYWLVRSEKPQKQPLQQPLLEWFIMELVSMYCHHHHHHHHNNHNLQYKYLLV